MFGPNRTGEKIYMDDKCSWILSDFLDYLSVVKGKSQNTLKEYRLDLITFFNFIIKRKSLKISHHEIDLELLKNISLSDMYAYMSFVKNERLNGPSARSRKTASLRTFYNYLTNKIKVIDKNITLELESPKIPKRNPIYLNFQESKKLLSNIDSNSKYYLRDYCIVSLFLNCALRLSELCSIDLNDIDWDSNTLKIIGKGDKERLIFLNNMVLSSLKEYLKDRSTYKINADDKNALFISSRGCRISNRAIQLLIKKYTKGFEKNITPHKLRHTSATLMFKHGKVDIRTLQKVLGHENISTTQIYTHVDDDGIKKAFESNPLNF